MGKYISFVLLVLGTEVGILYGVSVYFDYDFLSTMFFGSLFFSLFAFLIGSTGDVFTKNSEAGVFYNQGGAYQPKHPNMTLKISPFLVGSLLCFVVYLFLQFL